MSEMGDHDAVPRSVGRARRPRPDSAEGRRRSPAGHGVTATEAEQGRRRGLVPWWRLRSWSKDLDTLTRLHKGLRALDADAEQEFLSETCELADCGILLDVNNVYVSSQNHGFDPVEYISNIPLDRVGQIHVAGHSVCDGYLLDTHEGPVSDPVWALFDRVIDKVGPTNILLEWDSSIPAFEQVHSEALKAKRYMKARI